MQYSGLMQHNGYDVSAYAHYDQSKGISADIILPLAPVEKNHLEGQICQKFLRHLRHVRSDNASVKILASIQYSADMLGLSDTLVAKVLVDYGLRAPRESFPFSFLKYVDEIMIQYAPDYMNTNLGLQELAAHWAARS